VTITDRFPATQHDVREHQMTPEDIQSCCQQGLREIVNSYGRLVVKDDAGRVVDSGSAVLLKVDDMFVVGTAEHVVRGLASRGRVYLHVYQPSAVNAPQMGLPPLEFAIDPAQCLRLPRAAILDIAALKPPAELVTSPAVKWFPGERHAAALAHLRPLVRNSVDPRLSALIVGFPRFARFDYEQLRVQTSGSIAIWVLLQHFSDPPAILGHPSQLTMEIDPSQPDDFPENTPERACFERFWQLARSDDGAIGGYSGGPLMYFCSQGAFLVGIMKEANLRLGRQAVATPIDVFVEEVRQAQP
jgi:hypothetical protein